MSNKRRRAAQAHIVYPVAVWGVRCERCGAEPFAYCQKAYGGGFIPAMSPHGERIDLAERIHSSA